eukprot:COSAG02_NODE_1128_length_14425_cov_18.666271_4_plen_41_part_00
MKAKVTASDEGDGDGDGDGDEGLLCQLGGLQHVGRRRLGQ